MPRTWFSSDLETVATWWRIERGDGVALGFTTHDHDLMFDGLVYRTAPGMVPSAIRLSASIDADSAEVAGALSHDSIRSEDLAAGRFDGGRVAVGLVDWQSLETETLYAGLIGAVSSEGASFSADLRSIKTQLQVEIVPRTSPTCRAAFCGPGCTLSPARFTHAAKITATRPDGAVQTDASIAASLLAYGTLRWMDGAECGLTRRIEAVDGIWLLLDEAPAIAPPLGTRVLLREGCDHTLDTCAIRFVNAANFQGEPFLPGNDLLTSYPTSGA